MKRKLGASVTGGAKLALKQSVEYARDVVFSKERKGLVLVGRVVSEEGAMRECASWLGRLVPDVKVQHVPAGDPYWRPA